MQTPKNSTNATSSNNATDFNATSTDGDNDGSPSGEAKSPDDVLKDEEDIAPPSPEEEL